MGILRTAIIVIGCLATAAAIGAPVSVSGLIGTRVAGPHGERVGTIHDFAVDVGAGQVRYAVVEHAETSTRPRELRAVPFDALRPGLAPDQLVLSVDAKPAKEETGAHLMRAKALLGMAIDHPSGADYGVIEDLVADLDSGRLLHAKVLLDAAPRGAQAEVPLSALRFPPAESRAILTLAAARPAAMRASELIGMAVRRPGADAGGRIEDLVLDLHNNRVHYAVLDMGERLITEPLGHLTFPRGSSHAQLVNPQRGPVPPRAGMTLVRASTLLGWQVESEPGVDLGTVTEVMVDPASGRIPFAVVRLLRDTTAPLRAVPLDAFAMYLLRENLVYTGPQGTLIAAEGFTPAQLATPGPAFVSRHAEFAERLSADATTGATVSPPSSALFRQLDGDGNGVLVDAELDRRIAEARNWLAIDLDRDGRITADEFTGIRQ
jgi:sporulation protein YlmC with PRC-barrel domain